MPRQKVSSLTNQYWEIQGKKAYFMISLCLWRSNVSVLGAWQNMANVDMYEII
jgi:hypothetical protein